MKMTGQKIKEIFGPFAVYYVVYHAAFILLLLVLQSAAKLAGREWTAWTTPEQTAATGILGGISMVLGILPLLKPLQKELSDRGETFIRTKDVVPQQTVDKKNSVQNGLVTVLAAVTASLGWNIVFSLSGLVQLSGCCKKSVRSSAACRCDSLWNRVTICGGDRVSGDHL